MLERKGGPFGAVIVKDRRIIGRGCNSVISDNDPTAHAEIVAIRDACGRLKSFTLDGCEIYTSCQPCPMCLAAIYWSRMDRVYYANTRDDAHAAGFDDAHFHEEMSLAPGSRGIPMKQLMRDKAIAVFDEWNELPDKTAY